MITNNIWETIKDGLRYLQALSIPTLQSQGVDPACMEAYDRARSIATMRAEPQPKWIAFRKKWDNCETD